MPANPRRPRIRLLRPDFFSDDVIGSCSMAARLLLMGLWCYADRRGFVPDLPDELSGRVFPGQRIRAEPLLAELAEQRLITRGGGSIQVERWSYWQPGLNRVDHHKGLRGESARYVRMLLADPCSYCGQSGRPMAVDHIEPLSRGGANHWRNLTGACRRCNGRKGTKGLLAFLAARPWEGV